MSRRDTRTPEQQELDERCRAAEEAESRLDETLTRREVIEAIEHVIDQHSVYHESATRELLQKLVKALS